MKTIKKSQKTYYLMNNHLSQTSHKSHIVCCFEIIPNRITELSKSAFTSPCQGYRLDEGPLFLLSGIRASPTLVRRMSEVTSELHRSHLPPTPKKQSAIAFFFRQLLIIRRFGNLC